MKAKSQRVSRQKIALVHVAAHQLGMDDAQYRAVLMGAAGVPSARDLSPAGFDAVMRRFVVLGFVPAAPGATAAPSYGERPGMASPAQIRAIRALWHAWHDGEAAGTDTPETAQALRTWLRRSFHISDLRFCDVATAQKAIEGLKAMNARKARAHESNEGKAK